MNIFYKILKIPVFIYFRLFYRLKVYGIEHFHEGGAIIAPNHTSYLDPPLVGVAAPGEISFLAKKSLFQEPVLGFIIRHLNAYPVTGTSRDLASFKVIGNLLDQNKKVLIFPEGIRSSDGNLVPLKTGIGLLASRAKCPVIPVYIHGTFEIWGRERKFPKLWGNTACVFGTPIQWEEFSSLPKKEAQEAIAKKVGESIESLRQWYLDGACGIPP